MISGTIMKSEFASRIMEASQELRAKESSLRALGQEKEVIVYSFGDRGTDLARQLRKLGVTCIIYDNSSAAVERARAEGFLVTSDLTLDRPLIVAAGQNQISILASLTRPAWTLAEGLYGFDLVNAYDKAKLFSSRVPEMAGELYETYSRLDGSSQAEFLDVLLYRASLDVKRIAKSRLPVGQMWIPPHAVGSIRSFCDVGAYDGDTLRAMKSIFPELVSTFAVEPNHDLLPKIEAVALTLGLANRAYAGAAWNHATRLNVHTLSSGMMTISEDATGSISADTLDTIVSPDRYDYVKFDVEGAEASALEGAQSTLKAASCISVAAYHVPDDLFNIPDCLQRLIGESTDGSWNLAFHHYSESFDDSIFYYYRQDRHSQRR